jgi:hypothetical protein
LRYVNFNKRHLLDHKRKEEIVKVLIVEPADDILRRYNLQVQMTMTRNKINNRMPKIMLIYRPNSQIRLERPLKRLTGEEEADLS